MAALKVGDVARQAGVNLQTVHYYERRGLLPKPPRTTANHRAYPQDSVLRVRFIKRAQDLGFTLKEIKELLSLRTTPGTRCTDVRRRAELKVRDIDTKIQTLTAMRLALTNLIAGCPESAPLSACPILAALDHPIER